MGHYGCIIRKHWGHYKDNAILNLSLEGKASQVNPNKSKQACHLKQ